MMDRFRVVEYRNIDDITARERHRILLRYNGEPMRAISHFLGNQELKLEDWDEKTLEKEIDLMQRLDAKYILPDGLYFARRLERYAPFLLFIRGEIDLTRPIVAVVGTRHPDEYGLEIAHRIAVGLANQKVTVVSGGAEGIDRKAHESAIEANGKTIVVMGSGLGKPYPANHASFYEKVISSGSCLISEYPMTASPQRHYFPQRNRLVAALSDAVIVVQAGNTSGALITAGHAIRMKIPLFAVPQDIWYEKSQGVNSLLDGYARPFQRLSDLGRISGLECLLNEEWPSPGTRIRIGITGWAEEAHNDEKIDDEVENRICLALEHGPKSFDEIILITNIAPGRAIGALLSLEMKGEVVKVEGGIYALKARPS